MNDTCDICIPCIEGSPFANLSAEGPEPFIWRAIGYCCDGQLMECESTVSYDDAYECVQRRLLSDCPTCGDPKKYCADAVCPDGTVLTTVCVTTSQADADALAAAKQAEMAGYCETTLSDLFTANCSCPDGSNPHTTHSTESQAIADAECAAIPKECNSEENRACNDLTSGTVYCPDGLPFVYYVAAGKFCALTKAQANAIAGSYALKLAKQHRICLGPITSTAQVSVNYGSTIIATGFYLSNTSNTWALTSGSLPPGLSYPTDTGGRALPITGVPTTPGTYTFTIRVTAPNGDFMQKPYTITVAGATLLAYYKLDESSPSNILHDEVASRELTITLGSGVAVPGKINGGLQLGITSLEWDAIASADWTMTGSFTVRFWLKPVYSLLGSTTPIVYSFGIPLQWKIRSEPDIWSPGDMALHFEVDCVGSTAEIYSPALNLGAWNHCVLWFEQGVGMGCKIDNGVLSASPDTDPITPPAIGNPELRIACSHFWGANSLDELAIWKRKLTAAEITSDYNGGAGKTYPNVPA